MDTPEGLRLRLMTLLSLYDLLPYSISNPPHGRPPLSLEEAIGPDAVRRCMDVITRHHPSTIAAELTNILRNSNNSSASSRSSRSGQSHSENAHYYSHSTIQGQYLRNGR
ncbi:hypothetical protein JR316_0012201 [Psilocybe cubensis]|uniref:Uncharacterized protein n=2 Tax=Psilocybe cubensis TaxID=181762 RepID=A0ACB8GHQ6_PSICU|nr:hypothetical protein JR316_0012201 [Psilocybe cubensis]KAH9475093.1 hypothetical protein JR316_0012201 [Psilocybe cubensis]